MTLIRGSLHVRSIRRSAALALIAFAYLAPRTPALAQCVTNSQTINNSGAALAVGLTAPAGGCIVNSGTVNATLTAPGGTAISLGIVGTGSITNAGTATATGQAGAVVGVIAIFNGTIVNSGTAVGTGGANANVSGLDIGVGTGSIANSGTVTTAAGASGLSRAIVLGAGSVSNSGTVTATAGPSGTASAITIFGNGTIANSATATASAGPGGGAFAVVLGGSGTIINTGAAIASGAGGQGALFAQSANSTVINAGAAIAPNGIAVNLAGSGSTLTLLPGSFVAGALLLGGTGDTINVNAANPNLTFSSLAGQRVTSSPPFVVSGNQVVTIDPTPFGLADKTLMDFTRGISSILDGIGGGVGPSGPISSAR